MTGGRVTANPAAHDHEAGYDVAGCRACYLAGSRWPWPGGNEEAAANPVAHPDTLPGASEGWCPIHERPLLRCVREMEVRVAELENMLIFAGIDPNATHMVMPDGSLHRVARDREAGA